MAGFANADLSSGAGGAAAGEAHSVADAWRWDLMVWTLNDPPDLERAFRAVLTWSPLWNPQALADDPSPVVRQLHRDLRTYLDRLLKDGRVVVKHAAGKPVLERRQADGTVTRRVLGSAL